MKKTILISSLACVLVMGISYAKSINDYAPLKEKATVASLEIEVSIFCKSIAKGDLEVVKRMISHGQNVNERSNGMTPLMYAARYNRTDILNLLVSKGADVNAKCYRNRFTALKYAKLSNAKDAIKFLNKQMSKKKAK
jgi:ankyrin repeat protein